MTNHPPLGLVDAVRDSYPKRGGSLEIYRKFENHRLLDGQFSRIGSFEDSVAVLRHLAIDRL